MKYLLLIIVIFSAIQSFSQAIGGVVLDKGTNKPLVGTRVYLVNPVATEDTINTCFYWGKEYSVYTKIETDSAGKYMFKSVKPGQYSVIVKYSMPEIEGFKGLHGVKDNIDSNIIVKANGVHRSILYLPVTCEYDKTANQLYCPKCKKTDKVQEILFGLLIPIKENEDFYDKYYLGGCTVDPYCNPKKHCGRCYKDF